MPIHVTQGGVVLVIHALCARQVLRVPQGFCVLHVLLAGTLEMSALPAKRALLGCTVQTKHHHALFAPQAEFLARWQLTVQYAPPTHTTHIPMLPPASIAQKAVRQAVLLLLEEADPSTSVFVNKASFSTF